MKIHQIKNIFPDYRVARYNLTAWQKSNSDSIYCIGREVQRAGATGEPDVGILKLFEIDDAGKITQERLIWKPAFDGINLEDPRSLELPNESLVIGLTAILRNKKGKPLPYPAIIKINSHHSWNDELPPFLIITNFGPGKNLTPIDDATFLFRPDTPDYNHRILVFSLHRQVPEKLDDIIFPSNLTWAKWKIGTTMSPIWLNHEEALFIVHGISIVSIKGVDKYVYSLGRAKLQRRQNKFKVTVAPEPIITPDNFVNDQGKPLVRELHPKLRRVIYSCGGVIKRNNEDKLFLFVNVGDRTTFEVELSLNELKADLF